MTSSPPPLPYAGSRTSAPLVGGGPPSWGPFVTAVVGNLIGGGMLLVVWAGWLTISMVTMPFVVIPCMIAAFTLAGASMGWMFLLFGRFGRRTRWLWPSGILLAVIILELFGLTYFAGVADQLASGG